MKKMAIAMIIMLLLAVGCAKVENAEPKEEKVISRFVQVEMASTWRIKKTKYTLRFQLWQMVPILVRLNDMDIQSM